MAAEIHRRLEPDAGEHGHEPALEVLREAEMKFPNDDARHVGDPKDCVRHVGWLLFVPVVPFPLNHSFQKGCVCTTEHVAGARVCVGKEGRRVVGATRESKIR